MEKRINHKKEKQVLKVIINLISSGKSKTITNKEVARITKTSSEEVYSTFVILSNMGLIEIKEIKKGFIKALPTSFGESQNRIWQRKSTDAILNWIKKPLGFIFTLLVTSGFAFLLWYLGFDANSTNMTPLPITSPIQIYKPYFYSLDATMWEVMDMNALTDILNKDDVSPFYKEHFSNAREVSTSGEFDLYFEVENTAKFSQADLKEIIIEAEREPVPPITEIYQDPIPLGGGYIREYDATVTFKNFNNKKENQVVKATPKKGENFNFVTLLPGERESVHVKITVPYPGYYKLTPVARFSYQKQMYEHRFESINILIPQSYHFSRVSENGRGEFLKYPFTVTRKPTSITIDGLIKNSMPFNISFKSLSNVLMCRSFAISKDFISSTGENDPLCYVGAKADYPQLSVDEQRVITESYGNEYGEVSLSPDGKWIAIVLKSNSNISDRTNSGRIIFMNSNTLNTLEVLTNSDYCGSVVWSPIKYQIAFICRYDDGDGYLNPDDPAELWVSDINGNSKSISSDRAHQYKDPVWSSGGDEILVGGDGLWIVPLNSNRNIVNVFNLPDCYQCISNPNWDH